MCFTLYSHSIQRADQHIANIEIPSYLPTRIHPVQLKNHKRHFTQNLHRKRCNNWCISFIHCGNEKIVFMFPTSQLMLGRNWLAIWMHRNSLFKNLTPFEDEAEIRLLNFLMQSVCTQPEDTFIKMASLKIDIYFEIFKQLKNHVLIYLTGATQHKDTGTC